MGRDVVRGPQSRWGHRMIVGVLAILAALALIGLWAYVELRSWP